MGTAKETHQFGGQWTDDKLLFLRKYLRAFTTALSRSPYQLEYIDAFAGSGERQWKVRQKQKQLNQEQPASDEQPHLQIFDIVDHSEAEDEEAETTAREIREGSARLALQTTPPFNRYTFIEKNRKRCAKLEELRKDFPALSERIWIRQGDANSQLVQICEEDWRTRRAVLFLDPYGLQVEWRTLEAVSRTRAIDLWLLFPLFGVNRMITKSGEIPASWRERLTLLFGTRDWETAFYRAPKAQKLFDDDPGPPLKASIDTIGAYFLRRLAACFPGTARNPAVLRNSNQSPLFLFCFACSNETPKAQNLALKIANDILTMGS